jgi:signal peptidase
MATSQTAAVARHLAQETRRRALALAPHEPEVAPAPPAPRPTLVPEVAEPAVAKPRSVLRTIANVVGLLLTIAAVVFWVMFLRPQSLGGTAAYVLVSGHSMLPRYKTGDLVLVEKHSSYHVGEVIAYHVPKGSPVAGAQVIHRIIGGNGKTGFIVKGDNRTAPDVWHPTNKDVVGAKALRIPDGVLVLTILRSPLLLGLLAASFAFVFILSREGDDDPDETPAPEA